MLRARQAAGTRSNEVIGQLQGALLQMAVRNHFRDHSEFFRLGGFDDAAGQQQIARTLVSNLPGKKYGDNGGKKTDFYLRVTELGFGHPPSKIAKGCDTPTPGITPPR